jgi:hypothetical protein
MMNWNDLEGMQLVTVLGGPLDGRTVPAFPDLRTMDVAGCLDGYYEIMRHKDFFAYVWHSASHGFAHHVAKSTPTGDTPDA